MLKSFAKLNWSQSSNEPLKIDKFIQEQQFGHYLLTLVSWDQNVPLNTTIKQIKAFG